MSKYNPTSTMEDDESYNTIGNNIAFEVEQALQLIVDKYTEQNVSMRDISHIVVQKISYLENQMILKLRRRAESKKPAPTFQAIKEFLESWGLNAYGSGSCAIPFPTAYDRMQEQALDVGGLIMKKYISSIINVVHGGAYLKSPYWDELESAWNTFKEEKSYLAE